MDKLFLGCILIYFFISTIKLYEKMNTEQFNVWKHVVIPIVIIVGSLISWSYLFN